MNDKVSDVNYKNGLIRNTLGSGGKVIVKLQDSYGRKYYIERIYGHDPVVLGEDRTIKDITVNTLIHNPLYFVQKDLSSPEREGFEHELLDKLLGDLRKDIVDKIDKKEDLLLKTIFQHKIDLFKEKGVVEKLKKTDILRI